MSGLTLGQQQLLQDYRDRAYITAILCEEEVYLNTFYKNLFNLPLIFISSIMSVLNSSDFNPNEMKLPNIILNISTSLILSLSGSLKFVDKITNFQNIGRKFTKLTHNIEDSLINNIDDIDIQTIRRFINEYDNLYEQIDYPFSNRIKQKITKRFKGIKTLPNILNCVNNVVRLPSNNDIANV